MKWLIASDIHGSDFYCAKLLEAHKKEGADKLLLLGDILYHGPRNDLTQGYNPKTVITMLNDMKNDIICVRGNCDSEVDQMVLEFPIMSDYILICEGDISIFATHGHKYNESNPPLLGMGDIVVHGHTHIPRCDMINNILYLNPGSVSLPKANSQHGYMIFENGIFEWKTLDGEIYKSYNVK